MTTLNDIIAKGYFEHYYFSETHDTELRCFLNYEPAEKGSRDEPGEPELIEMVHVFNENVEVFDLPSWEVDAIEQEALSTMIAESVDDFDYPDDYEY